jgi:rhodanese-related sulfurtransferase
MKNVLNVSFVALMISCSRHAPKNNAAGVAKVTPTNTAQETGKVKDIPIDEVSAIIRSNNGIVVDANSPTTRKQWGTLPGAVLLTNSYSFDMAEIGNDKGKQIVFYCGGVGCKRAQAAGYQNVTVMEAGIVGWVEAGQKVSKVEI